MYVYLISDRLYLSPISVVQAFSESSCSLKLMLFVTNASVTSGLNHKQLFCSTFSCAKFTMRRKGAEIVCMGESWQSYNKTAETLGEGPMTQWLTPRTSSISVMLKTTWSGWEGKK
jgi:hypothetical protein